MALWYSGLASGLGVSAGLFTSCCRVTLSCDPPPPLLPLQMFQKCPVSILLVCRHTFLLLQLTRLKSGLGVSAGLFTSCCRVTLSCDPPPPLLPLQVCRGAQSAFCYCDAVQAHVFAVRGQKAEVRAGHVCWAPDQLPHHLLLQTCTTAAPATCG